MVTGDVFVTSNNLIQRVLVLGGGTAGFLAAITLKAKIPALQVVVLRSREIGIIGVGEGTTVGVPRHLHRYLGVDTAEFYRLARPIWKLGVRFLWGKRPYFDYTFGAQLRTRYAVLPKYCGYYCDDTFDEVGLPTALMSRDRAILRKPGGAPFIGSDFGYHFDNQTLCAYLESLAGSLGVVVCEGNVNEVMQDDQGITGLHLEEGPVVSGDLYVDCSGFRSMLLGGALREPFFDFKSSLFCDRAVVGGWARGAGEPIQPYTVAETMDNGWCWRIDHEDRINRGYVFSSAFCTDDDAEREFRQKNSRIDRTRIVRFVTGRYARSWVKNVVALGNAGGFVEPLEATSLAAICTAVQNLTEVLIDCERQPNQSWRDLVNLRHARDWDAIRRFLAVHYKFNTRLDTTFWRECRARTDLAGAEPVVEFYEANGPTPIACHTLLGDVDQFGAEGYLSMLVGQQVPHRRVHQPAEAERQTWEAIRQSNARHASFALSVNEALAMIRSPNWVWPKDYYT
jgi:tryptophan halogenase